MGTVMKIVGCLLLAFTANGLFAQTDIDTLFSGAIGSDGKLIKQDSTGYYYRFKHQPNRIIYYGKDWYYKLFNNRYQLLLSGQITQKVCSQLVYKGDKWTSYYTNGQIKTEGFYESNQAVGTWRHFYSNGQLAKTYTIEKVDMDSVTAHCKKGPYEEYYPNGQMKMSGNFTITSDSIGNFRPVYDSMGNVTHYITCRMPTSRPSGIWLYYKVTGELERKEIY